MKVGDLVRISASGRLRLESWFELDDNFDNLGIIIKIYDDPTYCPYEVAWNIKPAIPLTHERTDLEYASG